MNVLIVPINGETSRMAVTVDGKRVGVVHKVVPDTHWDAWDGTTRIGIRWMPEGVPATVPGPQTRTEAALLLLALEGYDPEQSIRALRLDRGRAA